MDLRIYKTYTALSSAFLDLMKEKNFEEITVGELCQRAMVRRATFYKHFADKVEFFAFVMRNEKEKFNERTRLLSPDQPIEVFTDSFIDYIFLFTAENRKAISHIIASSLYAMLSDIIVENMTVDFMEVLSREEKDGRKFVASPKILSTMLTSAMIFTLVDWFNNPCGLDEQAIKTEMHNVAFRIIQ